MKTLGPSPNMPKLNMRTLGVLLAQFVGWAWFLIAGVGGLMLLVHQGPWPITNGWFAMFSGISACPLTGWLLKKRGVPVPGYVQFVAALLIMVAGRVAVVVVLHRPFLPQRSGWQMALPLSYQSAKAGSISDGTWPTITPQARETITRRSHPVRFAHSMIEAAVSSDVRSTGTYFTAKGRGDQ